MAGRAWCARGHDLRRLGTGKKVSCDMNWNNGQSAADGGRPCVGNRPGGLTGKRADGEPGAWRMDRAIRTMRFRGAEEAERAFASRPKDEQRALLLDTRPLHIELARRSGPAAPAGQAGQYRTAGQELDPTQVFGVLGEDMTIVPGARVAGQMEELTGMIETLLDQPGDAGARLGGLGQVLAKFLMIHPYQGGNGRIARILVAGLARQLKLPLNGRWTIGARGYGPGLFAAIQTLPASSRPLDLYMRRFMADPALRLQPRPAFPFVDSRQGPSIPQRVPLRR